MTHHYTKTLLLVGLLFVGLASAAKAAVDERAPVYDKTGRIVRTVEAECVRTKWLNDNDRCASRPLVKMVQQQTVRKVKDFSKDERTVYFVFDRSFLTEDSKNRLNTLTTALKADVSVKEAKIVGFADRIGRNDYNQRLSQKRAETVRDYLIENGYTKASVTDTRWVGEEEPRANCEGVTPRAKLIDCLQVDRRVEVEMVYLEE